MCVCVCVCVTDPSLLQDYIKLGHTHITTVLHSTFAPPILCSKTLHHRTHGATEKNFCHSQI